MDEEVKHRFFMFDILIFVIHGLEKVVFPLPFLENIVILFSIEIWRKLSFPQHVNCSGDWVGREMDTALQIKTCYNFTQVNSLILIGEAAIIVWFWRLSLGSEVIAVMGK